MFLVMVATTLGLVLNNGLFRYICFFARSLKICSRSTEVLIDVTMCSESEVTLHSCSIPILMTFLGTTYTQELSLVVYQGEHAPLLFLYIFVARNCDLWLLLKTLDVEN